ncbi:MAG: HEAT repeat domain-containing protein [Sedimentisphaerales bacterium]|nr:HEAT repeat domain-containing protein [Sedimentisphaerales bacterium]
MRKILIISMILVTGILSTNIAAAGQVTQMDVPDNSPTADKVSIRPVSDSTFEEIKKYDFGKSRQALAAIEEQIRNVPPNSFGRIEAMLLDALDAPETTFAGKQFVCRMLRRVGSVRSVPALSKLLYDKELSHMARFALAYMPEPQAGAALREALGKLEGNLKIGVVGTLSLRQDTEAVPQIAGLLNSNDKNMAFAAISALGRIGGAEAAQVLLEAKVAQDFESLKDDSCLMCADKMLDQGKTEEAVEIYRRMTGKDKSTMIRIAAYKGLVQAEKEKAVPIILALLKDEDFALRQTAGKFVVEMSDPKLTKAFASQLDSLSTDVRIVLISALESRGDKSAAPYIAKAIGKDHPSVQLAAIKALAVLGDASNVKLLANVSTEQGDLGKAALNSLSRLTGDGITDSLLDMARSKTDVQVRCNVIQTIINRRETLAVPILLEAAGDDNADVRQASYKALGVLAGQAEIPVMISLLLQSKSNTDSSNIERAISAIISRTKEPDAQPVIDVLKKADDQVKPYLLSILAKIGGQNALEAVKAQIDSDNADVKKGAVRALANWPDSTPLHDLFAVAKQDQDAACRILALQGYIKLVSLPANRPVGDTIDLLAKGARIAERADEKRAILSLLPGYPCEKSLKLATEISTDQALAEEAQLALKKVNESIITRKLKATASSNNGDVKNALDDNKATRWATGHGMKPGDWFMLDLGTESRVKGITLDAAGSKDDYPRGYEVYVSFDGGNWGKPVKVGKSNKTLTVIEFDKAVLTRYIKIVQTGSVPNLWWSIHDLEIHFAD